MKRLLVSALIRLYPARWRAEYGAEFQEVLLRRPIGAREFLNVVGSAMWQQCRGGEPWILLGGLCAALTGYACFRAILGDPLIDPRYRGIDLSGGLQQITFCFAVGFWTMWRRGGAAGRAAMKFNLLATAPILVFGLLSVLRVAGLQSLAATGRPRYWSWLLFVGPVLQTPFSGLMGWLGGKAARLVRRPRNHTTA
jgi:hypothetical protein